MNFIHWSFMILQNCVKDERFIRKIFLDPEKNLIQVKWWGPCQFRKMLCDYDPTDKKWFLKDD